VLSWFQRRSRILSSFLETSRCNSWNRDLWVN
jgi:hypothetical protein